MEKSELLTMCCVCNKIRISGDVWLSEEQNPELYKRFIKRYEGRISHGYCPTDLQEALRDAEMQPDFLI